jgi:hypothetical protein
MRSSIVSYKRIAPEQSAVVRANRYRWDIRQPGSDAFVIR